MKFDMEMKKYETKIIGNRPALYSRMKKEIEEEKKKLKKNELAEYEEENWMKKAEINDGNAILPSEWIHAMLINACKQTGMHPHFAINKKETYTRYIQNIVIPQQPPIVLDKKEKLEPYGAFLSSQPGKMNSGKIWKIFPMLRKWSATFTIVDPFGRMKLEELKELLEYGGMFIGIGDQRNKNFGRFDVDYVREVK